MQSVKLKREELLNILKKNRETHAREFSDATEAYEKAYNDTIKSLLNKKPTDLSRIARELIRPRDHNEEYDTVIRMLELAVDDEVTLGANEFRQYVQNQWEWSAELPHAVRGYRTATEIAGKG